MKDVEEQIKNLTAKYAYDIAIQIRSIEKQQYGSTFYDVLSIILAHAQLGEYSADITFEIDAPAILDLIRRGFGVSGATAFEKRVGIYYHIYWYN